MSHEDLLEVSWRVLHLEVLSGMSEGGRGVVFVVG
jgi:hypothetical protein